MSNPLLQLRELGQSVWLDYLHRKILQDGELMRLIREDGLKGMTSNPTIFEKAIAEADDYDAPIAAALARQDVGPMALYEELAIDDIQAAADLLRPVYDELNGADGFVSLEVSPYLAMESEATITEARRLWAQVARPNVMIKVPGTKAGPEAISRLVGEGINVNVTLLFGIDAYVAAAEAHMTGLEAFKVAGGDPAKVHGVASIFVSRIDGKIDKEIDRRLRAGTVEDADVLKQLRGKVAIANAKVAYQRYLELLDGARWKALRSAGATPQRLLWASTGTKDTAYSDVLYVETLVGPDTINTMPPKTMDAFRDHGRARPTLTEGVSEAYDILASAERLGLDLKGVTEGLVAEGVKSFADSFDALLAAVADKRAVAMNGRPASRTGSAPTTAQIGTESRH